MSASELSINALVETLDRLEGELFASLLDVLQQRHLEAVRTGEGPSIRCPPCGSECWVKRGSRPRLLKTRRGEPGHHGRSAARRRSRRDRDKRLVGVGVGWGSWPEALPEKLTPELVVHDVESGLDNTVHHRYPGARTMPQPR